MSLQSQQSDFAYCLTAAAELLGGPVQAVELDWGLQYSIWDKLRVVQRRGLGASSPLVSFNMQRGGHYLDIGICHYQLPTSGGPIDVVRVLAPYEEHAYRALYRFWAVRTEDYRRFYRAARKLSRRRTDCPLPIMHAAERQRLWENTVGFLKHGCERLRQYGVPQKRGVLLLGEAPESAGDTPPDTGLLYFPTHSAVHRTWGQPIAKNSTRSATAKGPLFGPTWLEPGTNLDSRHRPF